MGFDRGHLVISISGWTCDVCDEPVNGQTDHNGVPLIDGDAVYHTPGIVAADLREKR